MTISISNLNIANNVSVGTSIGALNAQDEAHNTVDCSYYLTKGSVGYFEISGGNLVAAWNGTAVSGNYSVRVRAIGKNTKFREDARFTIRVGMADVPPPPVTPKSVTISPASVSLPDSAAAGTQLANLVVTASDGSSFGGQLTITPPGLVTANAVSTGLMLARALSAADDGVHAITVAASQNGATATAGFSLTVTAMAPPPLHLVIIGMAEDAYQGDAQYSIAVDGVVSTTGTITTLQSSGKSQDVSLNVPDGSHMIAVTFTNDAYGGTPQTDRNLYVNYVKYDGAPVWSAPFKFWSTADTLTVMVPPPPVQPTAIRVNPVQLTIPDTAPAGMVLATLTVDMSDGSVFNGTIISSDTGFFAISGMNLVTARALTAADDGSHTTTLTARQQTGQSVSARFTI